MIRANVVGNIFEETGYAIHTRSLAVGMDKAGIDTAIETVGIPNWQRMVTSDVRKLLMKNHASEFNVVINFPYYWGLKQAEPNRGIIGFGVWEGDKIHTSWRECANEDYVKQIWVPSEHTKQSFINGGVKKDIKIVPHGVNTDLFNPSAIPNPQLVSDKFTFLFVGGWSQGENDRKGFDILLRAFTEEFKKDEKVRLLAKINPVYNRRDWNLQREISKLNLKPRSERPETYIITELLPYNLLPSVYRLGNILVMPTKAEAFCLPCLEAMACGIPVITTDYGGQSEYSVGWKIKVKEMIKATDQSFMYEETKWAMPDKEHLKQLMRKAFNNQDEVKKLGAKAFKEAGKRTWTHSGNTAKSLLSKM